MRKTTLPRDGWQKSLLAASLFAAIYHLPAGAADATPQKQGASDGAAEELVVTARAPAL
ncbi:TPA: hypothetical protein QDZ58_004399, partial [Pluralibacter gergoviae]|nr:hypothetical protein [Pluralibacter gergoviae]